jgi:hypothetical protein
LFVAGCVGARRAVPAMYVRGNVVTMVAMCGREGGVMGMPCEVGMGVPCKVALRA